MKNSMNFWKLDVTYKALFHASIVPSIIFKKFDRFITKNNGTNYLGQLNFDINLKECLIELDMLLCYR